MGFQTVAPGALLAPTPVVMVSCAAEQSHPNIITVAWVGTVCSDPPMLSISVRPQRYSHELIAHSGEFVVNLVGVPQLRQADWCGVKSGREIDKFAACGFDAHPVAAMRYAPAIAQCPAYLACRAEQTLNLGSHTMFIGRIVEIGIRDDLMSADYKIDFLRAGLTCYVHGDYAAVGQAQGFFGFSVARPEVLKRRMGAAAKTDRRRK